MNKRVALFLGFVILVALAACGAYDTAPADATIQGVALRHVTDRSGRTITLPDEINTIVTLGPSKAEILVGLGFGDRVIAADSFSADVAGLGANVPRDFGITNPDIEYIVNLAPDIVFVVGSSTAEGYNETLSPVSAAGITVIFMPTSASISGIMEDIRFIAAVMGDEQAGESLISTMLDEIDEIRQIAATISEPRTVYFEVSPAPMMFSLGSGTFLNELIEIAGGINIFADQEGWINVADEIILEANPDVILTSTDFIDDPVGEIMARPGFGVITAVQNNDVFYIDTASSSRPTHNITKALRYIAMYVYPEYFR